MIQALDAAWLAAFVAVADHLHFGRAAHELHVTQSTVSHRIRRLEETLEVELFDRSRRQVALTPAGRAFLRRARPALAELDRAVDDARSAAQVRDRLVVGYVGSACAHPVMRATTEVVRAFPRCALELRHLPTHDQVAAVRTGALDAGSSFLQVPLPDELDHVVVPPRPLWLWVPADHRLATAPLVDPTDLADERFVLLSSRAEPAFRLPQDPLRAGRHAPIEADALDATLALVASGVGVTLLPDVGLEVVGVRRVATRLQTGGLCLFWRRGAEDPALLALIDAFGALGAPAEG